MTKLNDIFFNINNGMMSNNGIIKHTSKYNIEFDSVQNEISCDGLFVYGPYLKLNKGNYKLVVYGNILRSEGLKIDLSCNHGGVVVKEFCSFQDNIADHILTYDFAVEDCYVDFEVRIWVTNKTKINFEGLIIIPQENTPLLTNPYDNSLYYLSPQDLRIKKNIKPRVLVLGSCLAEYFNKFGLDAYDIPNDFILTNNLANLPHNPPHPIESYDFTVCSLSLRAILPDLEYANIPFDRIDLYEEFFDETRKKLFYFTESLLKYNNLYSNLTFFLGFFVPQANGMGRLMPRYDLRNPIYFMEMLNKSLQEYLSKKNNVYYIDCDSIASVYGKKYIQDDALSWFSHGANLVDFDWDFDQNRIQNILPVSQYYDQKNEYFSALKEELISSFITINQVDTVKMVIVDLDNTLWRGVLSEDGFFNNIIEGWPLGFGESLLFLKNRGIILGIASKNNLDFIEKSWPQVWGEKLKLSDFAFVAVGWESKAIEISKMIKEANILPNSVVFIDDNPIERETVKDLLPEIRCIGAHPYTLRRILLWSAETQVSNITNESTKRTEMIKSQVQRNKDSLTMTKEDFLESLGVKCDIFIISDVNDERFNRAFELLNKTNQYNTTGKRWTFQEMSMFFKENGVIIAVNVSDKYTSYGLTGLVLIKGSTIDQLILSCRVIGLKVEKELIDYCLKYADSAILSATLVYTEKNVPCRLIFKDYGFYYNENEGVWIFKS